MHGHLEALFLGVIFREEDVLTGQRSLGSDIVGIHPFPTTWDGATVEDDGEVVVFGVAEDVLVELHRLLFVTAEEVYLDAGDSDALHPCHLMLAGDGVVHDAAWSLRCIVPIAIAVVPQHETDTFLLGVGGKLLDTLVSDVLVPPVVHQHIFITILCGKVDELHLVGVVDRVVLPYEPAPGIASWLVVVLGLVFRFHHVVGNCRLHDGCEGLSNSDGPPRRRSR